MDVSLFDYDLPEDRIAQSPLAKREQAKLLVVNREHNTLEDRHIFDLPELVEPGDLLIFNDSKVFKARLSITPEPPTLQTKAKPLELFLLHPDPITQHWTALIRHSKKVRVGQKVFLKDGSHFTLIEKQADGVVVLDPHRSPADVFALCDTLGDVPTPPYVQATQEASTNYQTVYAKDVGSVAAPTAGFHFTEALLEKLKAKGVQIAFITLHVGLGTFRPMKVETLEAHQMHAEWISVSDETCKKILETKERGHKIIAVGTTATRALETAAKESTDGIIRPFEGFTNLFITPGYSFRVVDQLITNFHLPKSTLLVLVSSLAGRENILKAYEHAILHDYRFYSFGDAMLIR